MRVLVGVKRVVDYAVKIRVKPDKLGEPSWLLSDVLEREPVRVRVDTITRAPFRPNLPQELILVA